LERGYRAYNAAYREVLYPNPEGETLLEDVAPRDKKAASAAPKSFVDLTACAGFGSVRIYQTIIKALKQHAGRKSAERKAI
jgi:hypothetical protein